MGVLEVRELFVPGALTKDGADIELESGTYAVEFHPSVYEDHRFTLAGGEVLLVLFAPRTCDCGFSHEFRPGCQNELYMAMDDQLWSSSCRFERVVAPDPWVWGPCSNWDVEDWNLHLVHEPDPDAPVIRGCDIRELRADFTLRDFQ